MTLLSRQFHVQNTNCFTNLTNVAPNICNIGYENLLVRKIAKRYPMKVLGNPWGLHFVHNIISYLIFYVNSLYCYYCKPPLYVVEEKFKFKLRDRIHPHLQQFYILINSIFSFSIVENRATCSPKRFLICCNYKNDVFSICVYYCLRNSFCFHYMVVETNEKVSIKGY